MSLIELTNVSKKYSAKDSALHPTSIAIDEHTKVGLVGETGSGKSTLLKLIGGLVQADTGTIRFQQEKVLGPNEKLLAGHDQIAYLSQHDDLQKFVTVGQYLDRFNRVTEESSTAIYQTCNIIHLLEKETHALSGGEKQRVALAKELIQSPTVLLLDEPFSNLDLHHKKKVKNAILHIEHLWVNCMIMASHDPLDVLPWADVIWVFRQGRIIQIGTPEEIYQKPINEYVAGLFGTYNLMDRQIWPHWSLSEYALIDGKALIRPEQLILTTPTDSNLSAEIIDLYYHGSHEDVYISINDQTLLARTSPGQYKKGDKVEIKLKS